MKTKLIIFLLFITMAIQAQDNDPDYYGSKIGIHLSQDGKLFVMEDDHGNKPVTWDIHLKLVLEGDEKAIGHSRYGITTEYAELKGGAFARWGFEGGYEFTALPVPFTNIKYSIAPLVGWGYVNRFDDRYDSYEFSVEIAFQLSKNLDVVILNTYTERSDVSAGEFRYNMAFGLQANLDTNWLKKQAKKATRF